VTIHVLANDTDPDGDPLTVIAVSTPPAGTAVINGDGTITYTSPPHHLGPKSFTYTISDGRGGEDTAWVRIELSAPPAPQVSAAGVENAVGRE
jgi:hypothetical protein